jgi:hypothetical protein
MLFSTCDARNQDGARVHPQGDVMAVGKAEIVQNPANNIHNRQSRTL